MLAISAITYLLVTYQKQLNIRYSAWVTLVAGLALAWLAIASGVRSNFPSSYNNGVIQLRGNVVLLWIAVQTVLIVIGVIMKVFIPCVPHSLHARSTSQLCFLVVHFNCKSGLHVTCIKRGRKQVFMSQKFNVT